VPSITSSSFQPDRTGRPSAELADAMTPATNGFWSCGGTGVIGAWSRS
jgi:hypothetical protein